MSKTFTRSLLSLIALVSVEFTAQANQMTLGYCDGQIADNNHGVITGYSGSNATISGAIHFLKEDLAAYQGNSITSLRMGLPQSNTMPSSLKLWIRNSKTGENIVEGNVDPQSGWNSLTLENDYLITGEEDLWIGFSYVQPSKLMLLSFVGETHPEGCYVAKANSWQDFSSKDFGSLSIEAVMDGDNLPSNDLAFAKASVPNTLCRWGEPIALTTVVRNNASNPANGIVRWSIGGQTGDVAVGRTLEYREQETLRINIPTSNLPEGEANIHLELLWADGTIDDVPSDNVADIPVDLTSNIAYRKMVCEEGTGTWCGWCIRGIVGLNYMTENYGDRFIGIGVHSGDEFVYNEYANWLSAVGITGFPGCMINRDGNVADPRPQLLEDYFLAMDPVSEFNVAVAAEFPDQSDNKTSDAVVKVTTTVTPLVNRSNTDLRLAIVITEDSLVGQQKNYYAGGTNPMGGFENMPSVIEYPLPDVARIIAPSSTGYQGAIPATITKGENYVYELSVTLPKLQGKSERFMEARHLAAVALLLDGKTGEIINAGKCKNEPSSEQGIATIEEDGVEHVTYMTLDGHVASEETQGVVLRVSTLSNGKVKVQKMFR